MSSKEHEELLKEQHQELMEMLGGIFVQLCRIYDVQMMGLPEEIVETVNEGHRSGKLYSSPPVLTEEAWE